MAVLRRAESNADANALFHHFLLHPSPHSTIITSSLSSSNKGSSSSDPNLIIHDCPFTLFHSASFGHRARSLKFGLSPAPSSPFVDHCLSVSTAFNSSRDRFASISSSRTISIPVNESSESLSTCHHRPLTTRDRRQAHPLRIIRLRNAPIPSLHPPEEAPTILCPLCDLLRAPLQLWTMRRATVGGNPVLALHLPRVPTS